MVQEEINRYLSSLVKERNPLLVEMEQYAKTHHVPIMELVSIEPLLQILALKGTTKFLELGTAIGYSAIRVAQRLPQCQIVTVERDEARYELAKQFVQKADLEKRITLVYGDALLVDKQLQQYGPFDTLFIDAAKGQYQRFFDLYSPLVKKDGLIVSDNILYKGVVAEEGKIAKGIRTMVTNLKAYNKALMENEDYETSILPIGDGMAISIKR